MVEVGVRRDHCAGVSGTSARRLPSPSTVRTWCPRVAAEVGVSAPRTSSTRSALCSSGRIAAADRNRARPGSRSAAAMSARTPRRARRLRRLANGRAVVLSDTTRPGEHKARLLLLCDACGRRWRPPVAHRTVVLAAVRAPSYTGRTRSATG